MKTKLMSTFFIAVCLTSFSGCNPDEEVEIIPTNFTFNGTVTDTQSSTAITNVHLAITNSYQIIENGITKTKVDTIIKGASNQDGSYSLKFNALPPNDYKITAQDISGNYQTTETPIVIEAINWERKASDVNGGKVSKKIDLKLQKKGV